MPRRRTGRLEMPRTSTSDRRRLVDLELADRARLAACRAAGARAARRPSRARAPRPPRPPARASSRRRRRAATGAASAPAPRRAWPGRARRSRRRRACGTLGCSITQRTTATTSRLSAVARARARRRRARAPRSARRRSGAPAPAMSVTSSASRAERPEDGAERRLWLAPGDDLLVDEADRVADARSAPARVGARGRARPPPVRRRGEDVLHRRGVLGRAAHGRERDRRGEARLLGAGRHHDDVLLGQLGGALGRHPHVRAVRQDDDLLGRHLVDAGEQLVGRGVERRAAVERRGRRATRTARAARGPRRPRARPERVRAVRPGGRGARCAAATCSCMSATSRLRDRTRAPSKTANARSGSSVWTWTLSVVRSPTTRTESPIASSAARRTRWPRGPRPVTAKFVHQR